MLTLLKRLGLCLCIAPLCIATLSEARGIERCQNLTQQVRVAHYKHFGTDFPYHYSIGQLQAESNCRNIISRDGVGSEGVGQITYRVWKGALQKQGITDVKSTSNNVKAQAYINKVSYDQAKYKKLWVAYQIFNGGTLVNKELTRAGKDDWALAKAACRRKMIHFQGGYSESACTVNYDYSVKVYKYGQLYRSIPDSNSYLYW